MKNECCGSGYGVRRGQNAGGGMDRALVTCIECGRKIAVNKTGRLRVHADLRTTK